MTDRYEDELAPTIDQVWENAVTQIRAGDSESMAYLANRRPALLSRQLVGHDLPTLRLNSSPEKPRRCLSPEARLVNVGEGSLGFSAGNRDHYTLGCASYKMIAMKRLISSGSNFLMLKCIPDLSFGNTLSQ